MKELHDPQILKNYMARFQFDTLFENADLPFRLYQYEKGEFMSHIHDSASYLKFVVAGTVQIYAIHPDGSQYPVGSSEGFAFLGDLEFCGEIPAPLIVEAATEVQSIELPMEPYRKMLMNDNRFLRFVMHSLARKITLSSRSEVTASCLSEKLLNYMKYECPDQKLSGVGAAAFHLRCSRRQLQRILKKLTEEGALVRLGKGTYRVPF